MRSSLVPIFLLLCISSCADDGRGRNDKTKESPQPEYHRTSVSVPLSNYFGVCAFEWDFMNPADALNLDTVRLNAVKSFTGIRHYLDWEKLEHTEGHFTFNPAQSGSWNYDTMYKWCQKQGITVVACIKTVPDWMQTAAPSDQRGNENVPMRYGKDKSDPNSYIEQARMGFQYAARYGHNKQVDRGLVKVDTAVVPWPNGPHNRVKIGMGLISYIECDNERDKWWQGARAQQSGAEYAANLSAFYDGNKNTMGPGVGVKNADPSMQVVMAGLAAPKPEFVKAMINWCRMHRGLKTDGSVDLPWDVINYHYYCNDADYVADKKQTSGQAPELTNAAATARKFMELSHLYAKDMPVWVTETGYDINQHTPQHAMIIEKRRAMETQADWSLRTSLLYAREGIQKVFFYELFDDNPSSDNNFSSAGLINADRSRRPAADYMYQVNKLFGGYTFATSVSSDPVVDKYIKDSVSMYVLYIPDEKGRMAGYTLALGNTDNAYLYSPKAGSKQMDVVQKRTENGKLQLTITETPIFVTTRDMSIN